ncbi:MAG: hypothetical protein QOE13_322 [Gaiellaceae bacterium]|nr:hypothetical protein [Gaiellaceae bacterium]
MANTPTATPNTIAAWLPVSHAPPAHTPRKAPAQTTPINASPRRRRLPSTSFITGSWPMATPAEKTNQITPMAGSLTCAVFFANGGSSSLITAMPPAMKMAFKTM